MNDIKQTLFSWGLLLAIISIFFFGFRTLIRLSERSNKVKWSLIAFEIAIVVFTIYLGTTADVTRGIEGALYNWAILLALIGGFSLILVKVNKLKRNNKEKQ